MEIHCHSGYAILRAILQAVLAQGARLAKPGEFTLRAFLSGRLDLPQAEGVLEVIQARTEASLRVAQAHLAGGLGRCLAGLRAALLGSPGASGGGPGLSRGGGRTNSWGP